MSVNEWINQSINQWIYQSISQPINKSINHSTNQSICKRYSPQRGCWEVFLIWHTARGLNLPSPLVGLLWCYRSHCLRGCWLYLVYQTKPDTPHLLTLKITGEKNKRKMYSIYHRIIVLVVTKPSLWKMTAILVYNTTL